jgi:hypothetical protein
MTTTTEGVRPPADRYGRARSAPGRGRVVYLAVVGVFLALIAMIGYLYVSRSTVSGEVVSFHAVSDTQMDIRISVSKDAGRSASCTVRSRAEDGSEVGRTTVTLAPGSGDVTTVVHLRTTARGTTGELVGCS